MIYSTMKHVTYGNQIYDLKIPPKTGKQYSAKKRRKKITLDKAFKPSAPVLCKLIIWYVQKNTKR